MKDPEKAAKILILVISVIYGLLVLTTFAADRFAALSYRPVFIRTDISGRLELIDWAITLDPLNAGHHFKRFKLLQEKRISEKVTQPSRQELQALAKAIEIRPLWPRYHVYYALVLDAMSSSPNIITRSRVLGELKKAVDLMPCSEVYANIYSSYFNKYAE